MPIDGATAIAYMGAFVGLVGGGVALFNARKAVCWKRAELANTYMKDFNNNPSWSSRADVSIGRAVS